LATAKKAKGSAAGQYLGYSLQQVRLFYHLLTCSPDCYVGLEHVDDVSVHDASGKPVLLEQSKSALSQNPVSDWSVDLWKTFSNWADNAQKGIFDPSAAKLQIYVVPTHTGDFATKMSKLQLDTEISQFVEELTKSHKVLKKPPACSQHLLSVLAAKQETLFSIIRNFALVSEENDPLKSIFEFLNPTVSERILHQACEFGIGSATRQIDQLIRARKKPMISAIDFRISFRAFITKYDSTSVLHSVVDQPADEVIQNILSAAPPFVKQLELVKANVEVKTHAASDFLRSSADRTKWAEQGFVFEDSFSEYDTDLQKRHLNLKGEVDIVNKQSTDEERGLLLYHRCATMASNPLEGRVTPQHFYSGSLNSLADRMEIGWHPQFKQLMNKDGTA
jgi:hypothetical protein